jgi:hypothetical protein
MANQHFFGSMGGGGKRQRSDHVYSEKPSQVQGIDWQKQILKKS